MMGKWRGRRGLEEGDEAACAEFRNRSAPGAVCMGGAELEGAADIKGVCVCVVVDLLPFFFSVALWQALSPFLGCLALVHYCAKHWSLHEVPYLTLPVTLLGRFPISSISQMRTIRLREVSTNKVT